MNAKLLPLLCALALAACNNAPQSAPEAASTAASAMTSQPSMTSMASDAMQSTGNWVSTDSQVHFTSNKTNKQNKTITEESSFATSSAQLSADGAFAMSIDLASVKTNIDLRDERLRDWVFEVAKFPKAEISGKIDMNAISSLKTGDSVNLERAARFGDEIGGHPMSGHIIATTPISRIEQNEHNRTLYFRLPPQLAAYILPKGFIGLDGCSLTIGDVTAHEFNVHLIPETLQRTLFGSRQAGDSINIEIDAQTQAIVDTVERVLAQR